LSHFADGFWQPLAGDVAVNVLVNLAGTANQSKNKEEQKLHEAPVEYVGSIACGERFRSCAKHRYDQLVESVFLAGGNQWPERQLGLQPVVDRSVFGDYLFPGQHLVDRSDRPDDHQEAPQEAQELVHFIH
jgi:hypothetical protein